MNKKGIAVVIGLLFLLGVGIYYQLGGFNKIRFSIQDCNDIQLLGLTYRGTPQDEQLGQTFLHIEKLLDAQPQSTLHTIYYIEPAGKLDTMEVFVGMDYLPGWDQKGELETKSIPCTQMIVADIQAHRLVMPSPSRVKEELEAYAKEKGVKIQGLFVDQIISNKEVAVMAPLD